MPLELFVCKPTITFSRKVIFRNSSHILKCAHQPRPASSSVSRKEIFSPPEENIPSGLGVKDGHDIESVVFPARWDR